ncbi:unnamed protein product [Acanthosepion pharaonis]|uniref:Uncharacterized protein n=1 Tax=Acanthosepion pharaonis TaxID=158019 RepID=A0A812CZT7_ACAPH|nr:unnamed protein product [Sepia pharaonis]
MDLIVFFIFLLYIFPLPFLFTFFVIHSFFILRFPLFFHSFFCHVFVKLHSVQIDDHTIPTSQLELGRLWLVRLSFFLYSSFFFLCLLAFIMPSFFYVLRFLYFFYSLIIHSFFFYSMISFFPLLFSFCQIFHKISFLFPAFFILYSFFLSA